VAFHDDGVDGHDIFGGAAVGGKAMIDSGRSQIWNDPPKNGVGVTKESWFVGLIYGETT
jgi:hypothetical protein